MAIRGIAALGTIVLLLGGCGTQPAQPTRATVETPPKMSCPKPAGDLGDPLHTGGGAGFVPDGAVSALMCVTDDGNGLPTESSERGPLLEHHVDDLVTTLDDLPAYRRGNTRCVRPAQAPVYDLVLGYPDGDQVVVTMQSRCGGIARVGDEFRAEATGGSRTTGGWAS